MFDGADLLAFIEQATWVAVNDYEGAAAARAHRAAPAELARTVRGADRHARRRRQRHLRRRPRDPRSRRCAPTQVVDPTGCGDAYRAGLHLRPAERARLGDHGSHRLADGRDQDRARRHAAPPLHAGGVRRPVPRGLRPGDSDARHAALACAVARARGRAAAREAGRRETRPPGSRRSSASRPAVVTIEIDQTRAFDTEWNQSSQATGFVVDAERGLILTNRHVVTPGPVVATGRLPEPRGSGAAARLPRPGARLRHLPLRPGEAALHAAGRAAALSGGRTHRHGDPRRRQRRRRAAVDPRRHARAPRPPGARVRRRQVQRLQHLLPPGRLRHLGRIVGLAGRRHPRPGRRAERRRQHRRGVELLPAARARASARSSCIRAGQAVPRGTLQTVFSLHAVRRAAPARAARRRPRPRRGARRRGHRHAGRAARCCRVRAAEGRWSRATSWSRRRQAGHAPSSRWPGSSTSAVGRTVERRGRARRRKRSSAGSGAGPARDHAAEYLEFGDAIVHELSYQMARTSIAAVRGVYVANPGYVLGAAGVPRGAVIT